MQVTDAEKMTEIQKLGRLRISVYNFEEPPNLMVKEDHPLIPQPRCFGMDGIDLSGGSMTDSAGTGIILGIEYDLSYKCRK